ncbi:AraC family transcriptional regulator [Acidobacteria bacterium AH-259-O06]|nr:AraC family transcriptional regulator [Acidobacteria bacterium AH-259-O06]
MEKEKPSIISTQVSDAQYYYLNLDPPHTKKTIVVCGGRERCNADYRINRKSFRFLGIEFVLQGEGRLILNGQHFKLLPGMTFSYGPDIPCHIFNDPEKPMVKYFVDFVGEKAERDLRGSATGLGSAVQLTNLFEISEVFESLYREGNKNTPYTDQICAQYLQVLMLKIAESVISGAPAGTRALETYQRSKQYIDENFTRINSLKQIASDCHTDLSYLCRLFKRFNQVSPYQYLIRRKMNHAANLLSAGMLVKQVAAELNYSDPYHFSRLFKNYHRVSPTRFLARVSRGEFATAGGLID